MAEEGRSKRFVRWLVDADADLYGLLVLLAVLFAYELYSTNWVQTLWAASLFTLSLSLIKIRHSLLEKQAAPGQLVDRFLECTPPDIGTYYGGAQEVTLVGVSLDRSLRNTYSAVEQYLARGGRLRVVLLNPDNAAVVGIADRRAYQEHGAAQRREHILSTIRHLGMLAKKTAGSLHIKIIDDPLTFGVAWFRFPIPANDRLVVQHYSYKKARVSEPNPVVVLSPNDGIWFEGYKEELENLWRDGVDVDLNTDV